MRGIYTDRGRSGERRKAVWAKETVQKVKNNLSKIKEAIVLKMEEG